MAMAEPAFSLSPATAAGAARSNPTAGACRPAAPARLRCRPETPPETPGQSGAELEAAAETGPETGLEATDYTGFSVVGIAG